MIFFDAHVHIYDCFNLDQFFSAALKNFQAAGKTVGDGENNHYFLLLTETKKYQYFTKLQGHDGLESGSETWRIEELEKDVSLLVSHRTEPDLQLTLAAGRQIITSEGLELLALLTAEEFPDRVMDLSEAVAAVREAGGVAVCPWGAGKWLGRRGRILRDYLQSCGDEGFFLGDSGGRPSVWPRSRLSRTVGKKERLISGSDPLPLAGEELRAGRFGGSIEGSCDNRRPAASLRQMLLDKEVQITGFGKPMCPLAFVRNQLKLRMR